MSALIIKNIPDDTHLALQARAKRNGRSFEAEVIDILQQATAVRPQQGLGSELRKLGRVIGGVDLEDVRERAAYTPPSFK
jgi:plasmid stability protein